MQKLNNKGMTTVEILISFILIATISASLFAIVTNYNNKRQVESDRLQINEYKNVLEKTIQDDIIKIGVSSASKYEVIDGNKGRYAVDFVLKDGSRRRLYIYRQLTKGLKGKEETTDETGRRVSTTTGVEVEGASTNFDDKFEVYYGKTTSTDIKSFDITGLEKFDLPSLGSSKNEDGYTVQNLRLTNIVLDDQDYTLSIYIGLYHNDLGSKYGINIVTPLAFQ